MELIKIIGKNIRLIRKPQNLTIDELAEKCDFKVSYLSDIERGERNITIQTLEKLLNALCVKPESVLLPINSLTEQITDEKEELLKNFFNSLNEKNAQDISLVIDISNEILNKLSKFKNEI